MQEIWKNSPTAPDYLVSNLGRVMREASAQGARAFRVVKPFWPKDRRPTVSLRVDGRTKTFRVCNLVCEAFHGPKPLPAHETCHDDGDPSNNVATNLRWDTRKNNFADMIRHGTRMKGERAPWSKLTEAQVAEIRARCAAGEFQRVVAADYGIEQGHVSRIVLQKRWA